MGQEFAIVLAAFGASSPTALGGLLNIFGRVRQAFPGAEVRLSFTSNQIRRRWRERKEDRSWIGEHPNLPREILSVQGPLATVANLQDRGARGIVVQSLHVYAGEEYGDLRSYVNGLNSIRTAKPRWMPFERLVLGRPALGEPGPDFPYQRDLERAARALRDDALRSMERDAVLVYAGHGNPLFSTGVYMELETAMRALYPGLQVMIGVVEGALGLDWVRRRLREASASKVLLKPLMVVAGEHAREDICGAKDSWRTALSRDGLEVECLLQGLGEIDAWARLYVENARQAWEKSTA